MGSIDFWRIFCKTILSRAFRAWQVHEQLEEKMALLREEVMLSWYFFYPQKWIRWKNMEKPYVKMDVFLGKIHFFPKTYKYIVYFGC